MPKKRPIIIYSNSPQAGTGYGQQCAQLAVRLKKAGHPVAIASNYGQEGWIGQWKGIKVFPRGLDTYSNDVVAAYQQLWSAENNADALAITLFDVWVYLGHKGWDQIKDIVSWVPIDHSPAPHKVVEWCSKDNVTPVAMSKFGAKMLADAGVEHHYAPHANEPVFKPTPTARTAAGEVLPGRQIMSATDEHFLVLTNAANKGQWPARKSWDTNAAAMSIFMERHPDVRWYIHSERDGSMGGINLPTLFGALGLTTDRVTFTEPFAYRLGLPQSALATMYSVSDVLLAPALGEGFGVPVIEAQACGCPVIGSDWTATPELIADGWTVGGQSSWDPMQRAWWTIPSIDSTLDALEAAYARGRRTKPSQAAIDGMQEYGADRVFREHWAPILEAFA